MCSQSVNFTSPARPVTWDHHEIIRLWEANTILVEMAMQLLNGDDGLVRAKQEKLENAVHLLYIYRELAQQLKDQNEQLNSQ